MFAVRRDAQYGQNQKGKDRQEDEEAKDGDEKGGQEKQESGPVGRSACQPARYDGFDLGRRNNRAG
jgi:hypothetical protein